MKHSLKMNFSHSSSGIGTSAVGISKAKEIWAELRHDIKEIYNNNVAKLSFEALYRNSYTLVLNRHGALLYNGVANEINSHLKAVASALTGVPSSLLLESLHRVWLEHVAKLRIFRDFLMYMDKNYVISERKTVTYDLGLIIFHDQVIQHKDIRFRMRRTLLDSVKAERNGEMIDRNLMRNTLDMLMSLDRGTGLSNNNVVYRQEFEQPFLKESKDYYRLRSSELIHQNSTMDYLRKVEAWLRQEKIRLDAYLDISTSSPLFAIVEDELIAKHAKTLIYGIQQSKNNSSMEMDLASDRHETDTKNDEKTKTPLGGGGGSGTNEKISSTTGAGYLLAQNRKADLSLMYVLFCKVPIAITELASFTYKYIINCGETLLDDPSIHKNPVKFVSSLLALRTKFTDITETCFAKDKLFQRKLKEAFETFINADCRTAEYLSHFVDDLFKSAARELSEQQVDQRLNEVVLIFRYIHDKDVFEMFYKKALCKRLLNNRSISEDLERLMITKLKAECGVQFTSKLEGMFKDINVSKETNSKFKRWSRSAKGTAEMLRILNEINEAYQAKLLGMNTNMVNSNQGGGIRESKESSTDEGSGNYQEKKTQKEEEVENDERKITDGHSRKITDDGHSIGTLADGHSIGTLAERHHSDRKIMQTKLTMAVTVLAQGVWPTDKMVTCHLPPAVDQHARHFKHFYLTSHNGRVLHWQCSLGTAEIRCVYPVTGKSHDFIVSTLQMIILSMFFQDGYHETEKGRSISAASQQHQQKLIICPKAKDRKSEENNNDGANGTIVGESTTARTGSSEGSCDVISSNESCGSGDGVQKKKKRRKDNDALTFDGLSLTFRQICNKIGLEVETESPEALSEVKRHLISICAPKYRLLKKTPKTRTIAMGDVFAFNQGFKNPKTRIRVPLVSTRKKRPKPDQTGNNDISSIIPEKVADDRKYLVEACIVRVMKFRKELDESNLVIEVTKQLQSRFFPKPKLIKQRIESLIEREYLETVSHRFYRYLA